MTCCSTAAIEREFDARIARNDLARYRRRGPDKSTRAMLALLRAAGLPGAGSLLDIGGGIGALHHELLEKGLGTAVHVDAASAYLQAAGEETDRRGHAGRVTFKKGDVRALAADLSQADVVTLDRVVCCDGDPASLLGVAADRAKRMLALSFPRDAWYVRAMVRGGNWWRSLIGDPFTVYVHAPESLEATLNAHGLRKRSRTRVWVWVVEVYERAA